ncbi:1,4-dihydroxy-2-naphthoyl-CoA thioesterase 1, variant 2 [Dionaea muscipula]
MAEALASLGAHMAGGFRRVAGIHLSINHVKSAELGDLVYAQATPFNIGRTLQVWEVNLWKLDRSNTKNKTLISSSKVTLLCNMDVPNHAKDAKEALLKHVLPRLWKLLNEEPVLSSTSSVNSIILDEEFSK